ncbi:MAG TPA: TetR/AcrR family transcriptional regulator [Steroidobacteraceae bacterium]|nr:TetR/AcrR family transcriptional regulator [Steroidobacteraceae bacterium]
MIGSPEERKKTIARATCRAIIERGLHRMNMRDIARALGTTTGPLQHYFGSKEELLLYTKNLLIDELLDHAREAGSSRRGSERLRVVCEHLLPFTETARMAWLVLTAFNGRAIGDSQLTAVQNLRYTKCRQFFEQEIMVAQDAEIIDPSVDPVLEAIALASFVDGLAIQLLFLSKRETRRAKQELIPQYLERSFGIARSRAGAAVGRDRLGPPLGPTQTVIWRPPAARRP